MFLGEDLAPTVFAPWADRELPILRIEVSCMKGNAECNERCDEKKSLHSEKSLTSRLTGAVARSAEGTNAGHENAEGMASICVRVQPPVRRGREVEGWASMHDLDALDVALGT